MTSDYQKLGELIEDAEIALVTTVEPDGTLHTRPLATLEYANDGNLWFFTAIDSAKADELAQDMRVSVAYADDDEHAYVAIAGRGEILQDRKKAEELWTPLAQAWFPDGLDDPKLALLRVQIDRAEYWTSPGKTAYAFGIAKAAMTGKAATMGENRKLTM
jgi:general stress protein 26